MKKSVSPAVIVSAIVVVALVIGLVAYKTFGGNPAANYSKPEDVQKMNTMRKQVMSAHRDANGHFVDDQGHPINIGGAPSGH